MSDIWPTEISVRNGGHTLGIIFDTGEQGEISAELLRVESPSAEVKGHGPGQAQLVWGKRDVHIIKVEAVGNYAIRISFNDGHATGIFTWPYLHKLVQDGGTMFAAYLEKLKSAGLSR